VRASRVFFGTKIFDGTKVNKKPRANPVSQWSHRETGGGPRVLQILRKFFFEKKEEKNLLGNLAKVFFFKKINENQKNAKQKKPIRISLTRPSPVFERFAASKYRPT
jgi:hypothetical protein